jgi:hypothetical protein
VTLTSFLMQVGTLLVIGVLCLLGLRFVSKLASLRKPARPPSPPLAGPALEHRLISIDESWTLAQCIDLIETFDTGWELKFFAADHPSLTDPGATISVWRDADGLLLRRAANHGWHSLWQAISPEQLQQELYRNRAEQSHIQLRRVEWRVRAGDEY